MDISKLNFNKEVKVLGAENYSAFNAFVESCSNPIREIDKINKNQTKLRTYLKINNRVDPISQLVDYIGLEGWLELKKACFASESSYLHVENFKRYQKDKQVFKFYIVKDRLLFNTKVLYWFLNKLRKDYFCKFSYKTVHIKKEDPLYEGLEYYYRRNKDFNINFKTDISKGIYAYEFSIPLEEMTSVGHFVYNLHVIRGIYESNSNYSLILAYLNRKSKLKPSFGFYKSITNIINVPSIGHCFFNNSALLTEQECITIIKEQLLKDKSDFDNNIRYDQMFMSKLQSKYNSKYNKNIFSLFNLLNAHSVGNPLTLDECFEYLSTKK